MNEKRFQVPILLYHNVIENGCDITAVSPNQFNEQMRLLCKLGYSTCNLSDVKQLYDVGDVVPSNIILIQFDDGYQDTLTSACPILCEYGFRASIFVTTDYIGQINRWDNRIDQYIKHLGIDEIQTLISRGFEIEAHTKSHHNLIKFSDHELLNEIGDSKEKLERLFNINIDFFSYPYGVYDNRIKKVVSKVYHFAFSVSKGTCNWKEDRYAIKRFQMNREVTNKQLEEYLERF